jgi:DNA-binding phage protein
MATAPRFDVADYLDSPAAIADYLAEAMATGDAELIANITLTELSS